MSVQPHTAAERRLSVAMIVRDEQDVLLDTIRSALAIADEIVIVDTGSSDQTCRLADQLGARLVRQPWSDDFSAARNRMLAAARGDWIVWLNAGESLEPHTALELRRFVDCQASVENAYAVMVQLPPSDPSASAEQTAQPRLLPRRTDLRFEGRVRETIRPSIEAAGLKLAVAPGAILCHVRQHDPERKAARAQRNLRLVALEREDQSEASARTLLAMGEACTDLGQYSSALAAFTRALTIAPRGSTEMLEAYYGLLTAYDGEPNRRGQQLASCLEALDIFPLDAQLLCAMGSYLQNRNRLDLAARSFRLAMEHGQVNLETWHLSDIDELAVVCLGLTLQSAGKDDEACQVFENALSRHSHSIRIYRHLLHLYTKRDRQREALALVDRMPMQGDRIEAFRMAVLGACQAARKDWTAALGHLQGAYAAGCHDPFCLRWLSVTLLSNAQLSAAVPVLQHWQQLEPGNTELHAYLKAVASPGNPSETARDLGTQDARQLRFDQPAQPPAAAPSESHSSGQPQAGPRSGR